MSKKLFTLGPVEMFEYTSERATGGLPYFRTEAFSKINLECAERLRRLAGTTEEAHVFLLTCSGTGAMEAVVGGCFSHARDKLLTINGGGFGQRFIDIARHHKIPEAAIELEFGDALTAEMLDAIISEQSGATGLLVNLHETSTGQLYDIEMISAFCREYGLYLVCDAIGSFLADPLSFGKDGIDALIVSSQKALALPPGLAIVILSDRLYKKIIKEEIRPFSLYFDFREAEKDAVRGQTPYTPSIGTILALRERLERIEAEGGAEAVIAQVRELATDFRLSVEGLTSKGAFALPGYPLSNACTPLVFPDGKAKEVYKKLSEEHGVWLNPNGGALADKVLRVGHLGNLSKEDNEQLVTLLSGIL